MAAEAGSEPLLGVGSLLPLDEDLHGAGGEPLLHLAAREAIGNDRRPVVRLPLPPLTTCHPVIARW
jgi:hypothetical protein